MTTPSGQISLNDVNVELGKSGTTTIALGNSDVRGLAGVASGQISMNNLRGVSSVVNLNYTFSSNTADASLNLSTLSGYSAGKSNITVTINSGVYLYATSNSNYGLNITGGTTGDTLTIVNNGYIMGCGGDGSGQQGNNSSYATPGGPALNLGFGMSSCTINNTNSAAYIGGGGGGGGLGNNRSGGAGGGAGGGWGGSGVSASQRVTSGGGPGQVGSNGSNYDGGGGGRIFPGTGGQAAGGPGGSQTGGTAYGGYGGGSGGGGGVLVSKNDQYYSGAGGSSNNVGQDCPNNCGGAGGGGWGASGGGGNIRAGGGGGKAVNLNGKTVTWTSGNTTRVWGAVS